MLVVKLLKDMLFRFNTHLIFLIVALIDRNVTPNRKSPANDSHRTTAQEPAKKPNIEKTNDLQLYQDMVFNLTRTLISLEHENESLRNDNEILKSIIRKHSESSTGLIFDGMPPSEPDPFVFVQEIIRQKLLLPIRIKSTKRVENNSVRFYVNDLADKITVIASAKDKLKRSKFTISY